MQVAAAHGMDDAILFTSCFSANTAFFEACLGPQDVVLSDEKNHASIIDGIRLSRVARENRVRYAHADIADLETKLRTASASLSDSGVTPGNILIVTDSVFSMDGTMVNLPAVCDLAEKYNAALFVDESHASGVLGAKGRGLVEHCGVTDRVDVITSTFGKALGGAVGGFTTARQEYVDILRQRARPYLFSNTLPPAVVAASSAALDVSAERPELRRRLMDNTAHFREGISAAGFSIKPGIHPIVPVMLGDAHVAMRFADEMAAEGVFVVAFSYPVVAMDAARIRVQISASLDADDINFALAAFRKVGRRLAVI
jgi:glycine C-acetyltransferase